MLIPSLSLIWLAALLGIAAATLVGLAPRLAPLCISMLAVCAMVALFDAVAGARRIDRLDATVPPRLRFTKDVAAVLPITLENRLPRTLVLRLAAVLPEGIESHQIVLETT